MRTSRLQSAFTLLLAALLSASALGEPGGQAEHWPDAPPRSLAGDAGFAGEPSLSLADHGSQHAALRPVYSAFDPAARGKDDSSERRGTCSPYRWMRSRARAAAASPTTLATVSYLDFAADCAAARSGAVSSCSTCIPPPSHA